MIHAPDPATTVTRTLALDEPAPPELVARLGNTPGVVAATPSADGRRLTLTYDVRGTVMDALVRAAASLGLQPATGLRARLERAWTGFRDDNLRSQAMLEHHCCSTPPKER